MKEGGGKLNFKKTLNRLRTKPYALGYRAPATSYVNTNVGRLEISPNLLNDRDEALLDVVESPLWIQIRVKIEPIPLKVPGKMGTVTYEDDNLIYDPAPLYGGLENACDNFVRCSLHEGVRLIYMGVGAYQQNLCGEKKPLIGYKIPSGSLKINTDNCVYQHDFITQKGGNFHRNGAAADGIYPLWGYGGYYDHGCDISQIEQIYFAVIGSKEKSDIHLTTSTSWAQQGVIIPQTTRMRQHNIRFMDQTEHPLPLSVSIFGGGVQMPLYLGRDDTGDEIYENYESFDCKTIQENVVEITLKRKE